MEEERAEEDRIGFFVIPTEHLDELTAIFDRIARNVWVYAYEIDVQRNIAYRRALEIASHHDVMVGRRARIMAYTMFKFLHNERILNRSRLLWPPDKLRTLAKQLTALERRMGGEEAVINQFRHRGHRRDHIDTVRALYQSFKRILAKARRQRSGLMSSPLEVDAEANLEKVRAEQRERERQWELEELEEARLTPEEKARIAAIGEEMKAKLKALEEAKYDAMLKREFNQDPNRRLSPSTLRLVLLPYNAAAPLRRRLVRADKVRRETDGYDSRYARIEVEVERRTLEVADEVIELTRRGEALAEISLRWSLRERAPGALQATDAYTPTQARRLLRVLDDWQAEVGGKDGLVKQLVDGHPSRNTTRLARAFYRDLRRALTAAVERDLGLFVWR